MLDRLARRGPDGAGAWRDGPVGLGHRMLRVTAESLREKLPLAAAAGDVVVTADARLDNREELIAALAFRERAPDAPGDAELILRAWERWGADAPQRLLGDFAFAIWDGRRRVLFCARDPLGLRPFYYHHGPRLFAFASEVKALLALPDVPRRVDQGRVAAYLVPGLAERTATFFEGVRRLAPAHSLTVSAGGGTPRPYWRLDPTREFAHASDAACAEAFRALLTDAVRCRLRSAYPVGAALSGGLDSSSVVVVARDLRRAAGAGPLATYSAVFPTIPGCDERRYIEAVVVQGGLAPRYVPGDTLDPLGELEAAARHADETLQAPGYYMHGALYAGARHDGLRVLVEGTGGDAVVSHGTGHLGDLARAGRWLALVGQARQLRTALGRSPWGVLRGVAGQVAPGPVQRAWRRLRARPRLLLAPLRADLARRLDAEERLRAAAPGGPGRMEGARRHQWERLTSGALVDTLEGLEAAASDAAVELRDPFLDRRLVEFCLALPASQKIRGGVTRVVMRHAIGPALPPDVRERLGKAPLHLMLPAALAAYGRARLGALMGQARDVLAPYVDPAALERAYRRYLARNAPADTARIWRLATLTLWLRRAAP